MAVFLAWYETEADEKEHVLFIKRECFVNGIRGHLPHFHKAVEIAVAYGSDFEIYANGKTYTVKAGDVFFLDSFEVHRYHYTAGSKCYVAVISADYFDEVNRLNEISFPTHVRNVDGFERLKAFLDYAHENFDKDSRLFKRGFVDMLVSLLSASCGVLKKKAIPKQDEILVDAMKYITENSRMDLKVEAVAARFGYSPNYFSNIFNKFMGSSFRDYLNLCRTVDYLRLKKEEPKLTAAELAEKCGFGSPNSFYRALKKYSNSK